MHAFITNSIMSKKKLFFNCCCVRLQEKKIKVLIEILKKREKRIAERSRKRFEALWCVADLNITIWRQSGKICTLLL